MSQRPLVIEALDASLGGRTVLRSVDLEVEPGRFVVVLGASGCGKTTLLRAVAGFVEPAGGRIRVGEDLVVDGGRGLVPPEKRRVGVVFQDYALFAHMTVAENIAFGIPKAEAATRVPELLELVGLAGFGPRRPNELSGGQQQRVAIARALAPRPRLILLDEPFANLDAVLRAELAAELRAILGREGTAALMVTHDREDALGVADELVVMSDEPGRPSVLQRGRPQEVYRRPAAPAVARLTGPGSVFEAVARDALAETPFGPVPLLEERRGAVTLLLRPEDVGVVADEQGPATVIERRFLGRGFRVRLDMPGGRLLADVEEGEAGEFLRGARARPTVRRPAWAFPDQSRST